MRAHPSTGLLLFWAKPRADQKARKAVPSNVMNGWVVIRMLEGDVPWSNGEMSRSTDALDHDWPPLVETADSIASVTPVPSEKRRQMATTRSPLIARATAWLTVLLSLRTIGALNDSP